MQVCKEDAPSHIDSLLKRQAQLRGTSTFLECGATGAKVRFAQADEAVDRLAGALHRVGVRRHDLVLMLAGNSVELVLMFFAAARIGAVSVILHEATSARNLEKVASQTGHKLFLLSNACRERLASADGIGSVLGGALSLEQSHAEWARASRPPPAGGFEPGIDIDPVMLFFTSGSTGDPRGVVATHRNMIFSSDAIQRRLGYRCDDRVGLFLPLSFDYGFYQVLLTLLCGGTLVVNSPNRVGPDLLNLLCSQEISILPAVPTLASALLMLSRRKDPQVAPAPALRVVTNTGERLPMAHVQQLQALFPGVMVYLMYGLTECKRVSILLPGEIEGKPGSVGRPLDGTEVFVVDEAGRRLPSNSAGELVVRGANVCAGYWGDAEQTAAKFQRCRRTGLIELRSGDLCKIDEDGHVYFLERIDRTIKHRGHRVNSLEIEEAACGIAGVAQAAALHVADGDRLHIFIRPSNKALTAHEVLASLREILEPFKVPDAVHFVSEFPKTNNGKLARKEFEALIPGVAV
jgi:acyl-CoA synthetase (AMP-forming)/AMP-acid ligase II